MKWLALLLLAIAVSSLPSPETQPDSIVPEAEMATSATDFPARKRGSTVTWLSCKSIHRAEPGTDPTKASYYRSKVSKCQQRCPGVQEFNDCTHAAMQAWRADTSKVKEWKAANKECIEAKKKHPKDLLRKCNLKCKDHWTKSVHNYGKPAEEWCKVECEYKHEPSVEATTKFEKCVQRAFSVRSKCMQTYMPKVRRCECGCTHMVKGPSQDAQRSYKKKPQRTVYRWRRRSTSKKDCRRRRCSTSKKDSKPQKTVGRRRYTSKKYNKPKFSFPTPTFSFKRRYRL